MMYTKEVCPGKLSRRTGIDNLEAIYVIYGTLRVGRYARSRWLSSSRSGRNRYQISSKIGVGRFDHCDSKCERPIGVELVS